MDTAALYKEGSQQDNRSKMNNQNGLNKELFVPRGELLLVVVEVQRVQRRYRALLSTRKRGNKTFICVSVTKNKPQHLYISKVKKTGDSLIRKCQWTVQELRQVNGINPHKDTPEFELTFDNSVDHWVTRSAADKCIFIQVLYGACKTHLKGQSGGGVIIIPGTHEGQKKAADDLLEGPGPSPAPRSLRTRRKSYAPPKQTRFINCQPKLTRDAHQMNLVIYHCKAFLNRMKNKMEAAQKQYKGQEHMGQQDHGGVMGNLMQRMNVALKKRRSRLTQAEDRSVQLRQAAQRFVHTAHQLALRYAR